jgi:hypothetical protein
MNQPGKNRAMETVEKQIAFSHRSQQSLPLVTNQDESSRPKTKDVHTKSLTLPNVRNRSLRSSLALYIMN